MASMFCPPSRVLLRTAQSSLAPGRTAAARRFLTTQPSYLRRSWKSSAARWGIAIAGIYFYNTSSLFAEEPAQYLTHTTEGVIETTTTTTTPLDLRSPLSAPPKSSTRSVEPDSSSFSPDPNPSQAMDSLTDEGEGEGAFNPITGEINWDCPCLGGMAHGPCGEQFKAAFSCFVFSKEDPKGMDCIDHFQTMQNCFQAHPEVYKDELADDDEGELDEAVNMEREELVREIDERRRKVDGKPKKRLLEEGTPEESALPTPPATPPAEKRTAPAPAPNQRPTVPEARIEPAPGSEPHPGMSEEHRVAAAERR